MLGLAVDPGWPGRPYIYVLYARDADIGGTSPKYGTAGTDDDTCPNATAGCAVSGRLARVQLDPATDLPVGDPGLVDGWCQQFSSHSVGDLRFGPDGMLYASAGEGASFNYADYGQTGNPCGDPADEGGALRAQDVRTTGDPLGYSGAVIRVNPDGGTPAIVAYGFRNPFRFAVRPGTSELWVGDVGWRSGRRSTGSPRPSPLPRSTSAGRATRAPGVRATTTPSTSRCARTCTRWATRRGRSRIGPTATPAPSTSAPRRTAAVSGVAFASTSGGYPAAYQGGLFVSDYTRDCIWYLPRGERRAARRGARGHVRPRRRAPGRARAGARREPPLRRHQRRQHRADHL